MHVYMAVDKTVQHNTIRSATGRFVGGVASEQKRRCTWKKLAHAGNACQGFRLYLFEKEIRFVENLFFEKQIR